MDTMNKDIKAKDWYRHVHSLCKGWAEEYGYTLEQVVGVFAYLSPQKRYDLNESQALQLLSTGSITHGMASGTQRRGCDSILCGEIDFVDLIGKNSHKIRAFYHNILDPEDETYVCIDTHIIRYLWKSYPYSLLNKYTTAQIFRSRKLYNHCVSIIKREANKSGALPSSYQAQVWVSVRDGNMW